jgi:hypothetical protein
MVFAHDTEAASPRIPKRRGSSGNRRVRADMAANAELLAEAGRLPRVRPDADVVEIRESNAYAVLTPDEAADLLSAAPADSVLTLNPLLGDSDPNVGWNSLQLVADRVLPGLQGRYQRRLSGG